MNRGNVVFVAFALAVLVGAVWGVAWVDVQILQPTFGYGPAYSAALRVGTVIGWCGAFWVYTEGSE